jgi:hypothetical protein
MSLKKKKGLRQRGIEGHWGRIESAPASQRPALRWPLAGGIPSVFFRRLVNGIACSSDAATEMSPIASR